MFKEIYTLTKKVENMSELETGISNNFNPYIYNARIISVYDGDTVTAEVDFYI